ncbi:hypothetical protein ACIQTT_10535 [Microbacterium sp. NPDC090225]|uniref:hypothetical protein n=1 Tax=Microbacterium sp. NPDC090225 TaxID=3364207 RepID=UPI00381F6598
MVGVTRKSPAELSSAWPDGESDDRAGEVARRIVLVLREGVDEHGLRGFAKLVGVNHSTLLGVLEGRTWPSVQLVSGAELALGRRVWPEL